MCVNYFHSTITTSTDYCFQPQSYKYEANKWQWNKHIHWQYCTCSFLVFSDFEFCVIKKTWMKYDCTVPSVSLFEYSDVHLCFSHRWKCLQRTGQSGRTRSLYLSLFPVFHLWQPHPVSSRTEVKLTTLSAFVLLHKHSFQPALWRWTNKTVLVCFFFLYCWCFALFNQSLGMFQHKKAVCKEVFHENKTCIWCEDFCLFWCCVHPFYFKSFSAFSISLQNMRRISCI